MAKLNNTGVNYNVRDVAGASCGEMDNARVDSTRVGNGTKDDNRPKKSESVKVDIVTNKFKIPILVSF